MPVREIARNFSGAPSLLVSSRLVTEQNADLGFDILLARFSGTDIHLFRDPDSVDTEDFVEIPNLPADLIAIVATPDDAPRLSALWSDHGLNPPVIVVENLLDAVGPILACARAELAVVSARCADLQRALVTTRAEFEETRSAMHGVMRTLSHRYATKTNLVAVAAPSPDRTVTIGPSGSLRRIYPVGTESVTCFALHVASLQQTANATLTVVLLGVESGRILGKWRRPYDALITGWNTFDFPTPVAAVRETIAVEVALFGATGCAVTLTLSDQMTAGDEAPFSIRIWTAEAGGRFPHAEHWQWEVQGGARPASGTVSLVSPSALARIGARGPIEAVREGDTDGPPASYLLHGGSSLLHLADFSIGGAEGVCIELGHKFGDLRDARFELVVQSPHHSIASGWRSFEAADAVLKLGISLPAALPDIVDLFLCIEDGERTGQTLAGVALNQIEIIAGQRSAPDSGSRALRIYPEAWLPSGNDPAEPRFTSLKATNFNEAEKYAIFEVVLGELTFDRRTERSLKFKISKSNGRLSIEFRQGPNWPKMFQDWPGRERDRFGDVFRIAQAAEGLAIMGELPPGPDRDMLAALLRVMPAIVATGMRASPFAQEQIPHWLDAARVFAAAGRNAFGESAA